MRRLLATRRARLACAGFALAAMLAGCAGTTSTGATVTGSTLKIYAGQPPRGAGGQQAQDVLDAERLALAQDGGQVGHFKVLLEPLSGAKISDDARTAISDSSTIAYLGELEPHSSADSLGITNAVGLLQVSPSDTAIELTQTTKAVSGAPTRYYESLKTYGRTFGRVVPAANHEAAVQLQAMRAAGVKKLYVADDGRPYGSALALAVANAAAGGAIAVSRGPADPAQAQSSGADALFLGASDFSKAARLFDGVAAANTSIKLFAPSALDDRGFVAGLAPAARRRLTISAPGFLTTGHHADLPPAGRTFLAAFSSTYHRAPATQAIFGYEAMALVLDTLRRAGTSADSRSAVVAEFQRTRQRSSVLGVYSIDGNGDTTLARYVLSHFTAGGLAPFVALQG